MRERPASLPVLRWTGPQWCALQVSKRGEPLETCADAWDLRQDPCREAWALSVADGASTSSEARRWAHLLTEAAVASLLPVSRGAHGLEGLEALRLRWRRSAEASYTQPLAWFTERALEEGAWSTYLRVVVEGTRWRAEALGDSCLFVLREGKALQAFPLTHPEAFGPDAMLLCSAPGSRRGRGEGLRRTLGELQAGDVLVLATDAAAHALLLQADWSLPGRCLAAPDPAEPFAAWVCEARASGCLKDDDTTLLMWRQP